MKLRVSPNQNDPTILMELQRVSPKGAPREGGSKGGQEARNHTDFLVEHGEFQPSKSSLENISLAGGLEHFFSIQLRMI